MLRDSWIWWDSEGVQQAIALGPEAPGLLYGAGVFETLLVRDGQPIHLRPHLARMKSSMEYLGFVFPSQAPFEAIIGDLAQRSGLTIGESRLSIRSLVVEPTKPVSLLFRLTPYTVPNASDGIELGIFPMRHQSHLARHKTNNYLHPWLAWHGRLEGCFDRLLLGLQEQVLEAARGALLFARDGEWLVSDPTWRLPSIALSLASEGLVVTERDIRLDEIDEEWSCFYLNSLVGCLAVSRIGDRRLTLDVDLAALFSAKVRTDPPGASV